MDQNNVALLAIVAVAALGICSMIVGTMPGFSPASIGQAWYGSYTRSYCGNGVCNSGENCDSCPSDCGRCIDRTPPVLSNGQPTGTLLAGTTMSTMSVTSNEAATCRYSTTANTTYYSMTSTFGGTGTSHSTTVSGLSNGQSYTYYVRCQDTARNVDTKDYTISFSVASAATPTITITSPMNGAVVSGVITIQTQATSVRSVSFLASPEGSDVAINLGADSSSPFTATWDTRQYADGIYRITASVGAGVAASVQVTVKNNITNATCSDSDGGLNYYVRGITSNGNVSYADYCDSAGKAVTEYYCNGTSIISTPFDCTNNNAPTSNTNACVNGACVYVANQTNTTATPNILADASFETGWDGFTNWGYGTPDCNRTGSYAYSGVNSAWYNFTPYPGDAGCHMSYGFSSQDHVWVRFYFRLTNPVDSQWKFARFASPGFNSNMGGLFVGSDTQGSPLFGWGFDNENSAIIDSIGLTQSQVIDGRWHSLEIDYWRNGDPSGYPSAGFWFDGKQQYAVLNGATTTYPGVEKTYWQNGKLYAGERATSAQLGDILLLSTLNSGNSAYGLANIDCVSISSAGYIDAGSCVPNQYLDIAAPSITNGWPQGTFPTGTTATTMTVITDEPAMCKYSSQSGAPYGSMSATFTTNGGTTHRSTITGLVNGGIYKYYVRCLDYFGNADTTDYAISFNVNQTNTTNTTDTSPPSTPTGLAATAVSPTQVSLAWNPAIDNVGVYDYFVFRNGIAIATPAITSYTDSGLTPSTTYAYAVAANDAAGNIGSKSSTLYVATPGTDTTPPVLSSGHPSGTLAAGTTMVNMGVTTNEAATCRYGTTAGTAYSSMQNTFTTTGATSHSTTISGLQDGNQYAYYVRCLDTAANPDTTDYTISFNIAQPADTTPPSMVTGLTAKGLYVAGQSTTLTVTLGWVAATDNVGVRGYNIYRNGALIGTIPFTSFTDTGLSGVLTDYSYTVAAFDAAGNTGAQSAAVVPTLPIVTDTTPPSVAVTGPSGTFPAGTTSVTLQATTNEAATCRYSTLYGLGYGSMTSTFTTTGGIKHLTTISGLQNGYTYTYYVKCADASGNANTDNTAATFNVAQVSTVCPDGQAAGECPIGQKQYCWNTYHTKYLQVTCSSPGCWPAEYSCTTLA